MGLLLLDICLISVCDKTSKQMLLVANAHFMKLCSPICACTTNQDVCSKGAGMTFVSHGIQSKLFKSTSRSLKKHRSFFCLSGIQTQPSRYLVDSTWVRVDGIG